MYIKTLGEFINDVDRDFENAVIRELNDNKGPHDNEAEENSWRDTLPALACIFKGLPEHIIEHCEIVLEAKYAVEEKRADVVLVGNAPDGQGPAMLIMENKRWSDLTGYEPLGESSVWDPWHHQMTDHPSRQVSHYKTTLEYTNRFVQEAHVKISTMVYMQNGTTAEKNLNAGPFAHRYLSLLLESPIFTGDETESIRNFISGIMTGGSRGIAEKVYSSEVRYSREYENILKNLFGNREELRRILDDRQAALFDEIAYEINSGNDPQNNRREKKVFIVEGKPGTGKTFIAIALLAYLYQNARPDGLKIRYIEKNRDPRKTLQREMRVPEQAMAPSVMKKDIIYDCLICDESQRMNRVVFRKSDERDFIKSFIQQSRIAVFFYDEKQSVHIDDYATKEKIKETAVSLGVAPENIIEREMIYQHRCHDADRFLEVIDQLLDGSAGKHRAAPGNAGKYKAVLVDDPRKLFQIIKNKNQNRGDNHSSRVLAGKGRTRGQDWKWEYDNIDYHACRSIAPLRDSNEKLYTWNFGRYGEGVTFASDERSVELVGSIDTSQGLDFEYVGVIIAPDLIYDPVSQRIRVDINGHQRSDSNTGRNRIRDLNPVLIEKIIKNTYRVLLSRGEKGCYIYCCNKELQDYLSQFTEVIETEPTEGSVENMPKAVTLSDNGRKTGTVSFASVCEGYAYIKGEDGSSYKVSSTTIERTPHAADILRKGSRVTFTVWNGKKRGHKYDFANDIRPAGNS